MTDEQKRRMCKLLGDYDRFAYLAANIEWTDVRYDHINVPIDTDSNHWVNFITVDFEKGYVGKHFDEAVIQMMIMFISAAEDWSPHDGWKDMTVQQRLESFERARGLYEGYVGSPEVWALNEEMSPREFENDVFTCCKIWDRSFIERRYPMEQRPCLNVSAAAGTFG
ncbi:hypothetical protein [Ruminococcus sp.]|uniref:hypothetical protein n=1 Tax=Ruminococcus sp. TaxID=41978 RepID=UPI0025F4341D|nr:hypothetical protein [Ruminococcus sp.]MBQ8965956.1 hypothetical protein [Ruminococcus sp.]